MRYIKNKEYKLEIQKYLENNSFEELKKYHSIDYKFQDNLVILNYNQIDSDKKDILVSECRGLVLNNNLDVVSRPFNRFYNYGEDAGNNNVDIDFNNAYALEKLDGSFISFFFTDKWMISTRKNIGGNNHINDIKLTFGELFWKALEKSLGDLNYLSDFNKEFTYIFELISPYNRVVTPYTELDIVLLTIRHTKTGRELDYQTCNGFANIHNIRRPKRYNMSDINDVIQMASELTDMTEGYVVVEENIDSPHGHKRVKVKSPYYVALHYLKDSAISSKRGLLDVIMSGEGSEFLIHFPEMSDLYNEMENSYNKLLSKINMTIMKLDYTLEQKEFALQALKTIMPHLAFTIKKGSCVDFQDWFAQLVSNKGQKHALSKVVELIEKSDIN